MCTFESTHVLVYSSWKFNYKDINFLLDWLVRLSVLGLSYEQKLETVYKDPCFKN